jgi:hypothetical protein
VAFTGLPFRGFSRHPRSFGRRRLLGCERPNSHSECKRIHKSYAEMSSLEMFGLTPLDPRRNQ